MIERWVLPALAFIVSTAYWPTWHDGAVSPKWAAVAAAIPFFVAISKPKITAAHWALGVFMAWSAGTIFWSVSSLDSIDLFLKISFIAGAFFIASDDIDLSRTYHAMYIGVTIAGVIAACELAGLFTIPQANNPASLYGNKNYLAEAGSMLFILAWSRKEWWAMAAMSMAAFLPMSKGSLIAVAVSAMIILWRKSRALSIAIVAASIILAVALYATGFSQPVSYEARLMIWSMAAEHLKWLGHGIGAFQATYPVIANYTDIPYARPENAHNEYINTIFETGLPGAIFAFALAAIIAFGRRAEEKIPLACLAVISCFSFPLHQPVTGVLSGFLAGSVCRGGASVRDLVLLCRTSLDRRNVIARSAERLSGA